jgi:hypothetical protein
MVEYVFFSFGKKVFLVSKVSPATTENKDENFSDLSCQKFAHLASPRITYRRRKRRRIVKKVFFI